MIVPSNYNPAPHQVAVHSNPARFKVIVWHRKCRKTTTVIAELLRWAASVKGAYWYVAPYRDEAKRTVWDEQEMLAKMCPPEVWAKRNKSDLTLTFPNGSMLYVLGADNYEGLRGANPRGVVLDEFDTMKPETWTDIVEPVMRANPDAWTWFVGTPNERENLMHKYEYGKNHKEWFVTKLDAKSSGLMRPEDVAEAEASLPSNTFKREYMVEFVSGSNSVFNGLEMITYDIMREPFVVKPLGKYQLGVDWAKAIDWTVITPFSLNDFRSGTQVRFNQLDYNVQKARATSEWYKWNKGKMWMDSTGVGTPIFDDMKREVTNLEPFQFTEQTRKDLLTNLLLLIEQRKIRIPNDPELLAELKSMKYVIGNSGRVKMAVPDGLHDDRIMSLALSVWNIPARPLEVNTNGYRFVDNVKDKW